MTTPQSEKIAVVTMVYNEPYFLPIWINYYAAQVGAANLFVFDHGSDDGSTSGWQNINVIKLPRTPKDNDKRAAFLSDACSSLLNFYDVVIHVDVDELLVPDPQYYRDLPQFCAMNSFPVVHAVGVNVLHRVGHEPPLVPHQRILPQRSWALSASSMCKPVVIRRRTKWSPGFHCADAPIRFEALYLFHLRWVDLTLGLNRLAQTRAMAWNHPDAGQHQRISDAEMVNHFQAFSAKPTDERDFSLTAAPVSDFLHAVMESQVGRENDTYRISLNIWGDALWKIPARFANAF